MGTGKIKSIQHHGKPYASKSPKICAVECRTIHKMGRKNRKWYRNSYTSNSQRIQSRTTRLLTLGRAIDIADFYKQQARYAYGLMGANPVSADAEYILKKLRANHVSEINGRDLFHLCRKFKTVDELCQPIEILTEHGYLRKQQQEFKGTGRRSSIVYEVNPLSA